MKRIRNLALVAVSALALTAVLGVTAASASQITAESYPATLTTPNPQTQHTLSFNGGGTKCEAPALEGKLSSAAKGFQATAKDTNCEFFGTTKLKMNGCTFTYNIGSKLPSGAFKGTVDIGPAGCGPIEFGVPLSFCYVKIGAQNGLGATYENVGVGKERSVKVNLSTESLKYTQVSKCTAGEFSNGVWQGAWTVQGSNGFGRVGVNVESTGSSFSVSGAPAKFVAEENPTAIVGASTNSHKATFQYGNLECKTTGFSASVPGSTATLPVSAEYGSCTLAGFVASVNMNGCSYTFNVLTTTTGHPDIACPAGKSIEVIALPTKPKCTITIPAQTTDAGGLTFSSDPATYTVGVGIEMKGIDFQQTAGEGVGKCTSGSYTNGVYTGASTLSTVL